MAEIYTSGNWLVKDGKEREFIAAWRDLAEWTRREIEGSGWARLLQERDDPRRFLSFGPWESAEAVNDWRASEGFQQHIARLREFLEDLEPRTLDLVAEVASDRHRG